MFIEVSETFEADDSRMVSNNELLDFFWQKSQISCIRESRPVKLISSIQSSVQHEQNSKSLRQHIQTGSRKLDEHDSNGETPKSYFSDPCDEITIPAFRKANSADSHQASQQQQMTMSQGEPEIQKLEFVFRNPLATKRKSRDFDQPALHRMISEEESPIQLFFCTNSPQNSRFSSKAKAQRIDAQHQSSIASLQEEVESRRSIDTNIHLSPILKNNEMFMRYVRSRNQALSRDKCLIASKGELAFHTQDPQ